jgi:tRNA pseudouridine55 synthase
MQLAPKLIRIDNIELLEFNLPKIKISVTCGKGTYIRSLARDIGEALQSGAYLTALERTRIGEYNIEKCITPDAFPEWLDKQLTL